ncbi:MAG: hypothetical protein ABFC57_06180 [Veillonellales bacterium]
MKTLLKFLLVVTLTIHCQYLQGDQLLCDYTLQDNLYLGVAYDDMMSHLNTECEIDGNKHGITD